MVFISSQRKKIPPIVAVIIPTGISTGAMIVLDSVSAAVKKVAPRRNEHGSIILLSTPNNILKMCGIMSPTKPIGPVTEITAPAASDVAK